MLWGCFLQQRVYVRATVILSDLSCVLLTFYLYGCCCFILCISNVCSYRSCCFACRHRLGVCLYYCEDPIQITMSIIRRCTYVINSTFLPCSLSIFSVVFSAEFAETTPQQVSSSPRFYRAVHVSCCAIACVVRCRWPALF